MKKGLLISLFAVIFLGLSGCVSKPEKGEKNNGNANKKIEVSTKNLQKNVKEKTVKNENDSLKKEKQKSYNLNDIAKHSTATDCWFAVDGEVYDVTKFISTKKHPGGAAILEGCGKDASTLFNTRPMGSKTKHSPKAQDNLKNFKIGILSK